MNNKNSRGVIPVIVVYAITALLCTQLVPNWRLPNLFKAGPQTAQLRKAESDLAKAKSDAAAADATYKAALAKQAADTKTQAQYGQQMIAGVPAALKGEAQTAGVKLATTLATRASDGLAAAIGDLPKDKQDEINTIVEDALSSKQDEIDAANEALDAKDSELKQATTDKQTVEAQLPVLAAKLDAKANAEAAANKLVDAKTTEVAAYADKAAAADKESGSFKVFVEKLGFVLGILYLVAHFVLPSLAQEFPAVSWLQSVDKTVKAVTSAHA